MPILQEGLIPSIRHWWSRSWKHRRKRKLKRFAEPMTLHTLYSYSHSSKVQSELRIKQNEREKHKITAFAFFKVVRFAICLQTNLFNTSPFAYHWKGGCYNFFECAKLLSLILQNVEFLSEKWSARMLWAAPRFPRSIIDLNPTQGGRMKCTPIAARWWFCFNI